MRLLEPYFNFQTMTHSDTADKLKIDNTNVTDEQLQNLSDLYHLLISISHRLSIKFAKPVQIGINCAFRNAEVNKAVGGVPTSEHIKGKAADTVAIGITIGAYFSALQELAKANVIEFGQVISEKGTWIHISTPDPHHNEFMLTTDGKHYIHV